MKSASVMIVCVVACIAVGGVSAMISPMGEWYQRLNKPTWMPPGWLFGPVWTLLYAMMGFALFLILQKGWATSGVRLAVILFGAQLALNFLWSPTFFRFQSTGGALALIIALWLMIAWTIAASWSVRDWAGALLLPYLAWVTFATALNAAIWRLN